MFRSLVQENRGDTIIKNLPTNQKFGKFFTLVFVVTGIYSFVVLNSDYAFWLLIIAGIFAVVTSLAPKLLQPLNNTWHELGILLGKIFNPITLGFIFFLLITPVGLISRFFGRDELRMNKISMSSYWIDRVPPGPAPESFKNQF